MKTLLSFGIFFLCTSIYSQKGFYVDKDERIEKYQKDMISFLIEKKDLKINGTEIDINNFSGSMQVLKCIEVYPFKKDSNSVLLVRFCRLGSHHELYWGILEKDNFNLFATSEISNPSTKEYLDKYDEKTRKILLNFIEIHNDWYYRE